VGLESTKLQAPSIKQIRSPKSKCSKHTFSRGDLVIFVLIIWGFEFVCDLVLGHWGCWKRGRFTSLDPN
jgi:hypothetical protein